MRMTGVLLRALSISAIFIFSICCQVAAEEITISTYYPSPYGSYEELRSNKMVIGQEADGSVIPAPPRGGLTLAPQSQGNIGTLTGVPDGTLMYGTLTSDPKEKRAFHYWNGSEWSEMLVKQKGIDIAEAKIKPNYQFYTAGEWRRLEIKSLSSPISIDPVTGQAYAEIVGDSKVMRVNTMSPSIVGSGFHRITWGGNLKVNANVDTRQLIVRLRTNPSPGAAYTVDTISITDATACSSHVLCTSPDSDYSKEDVNKEATVAVKTENFRDYWIEAKTEGGQNVILGEISGFYFKVEKLGAGE